MAEQFLTLMADLDEAAQSRMGEWYSALRDAGFSGTQTPGLPYHISLTTYPPSMEREAIARMEKAAADFSPFPVYISHIGIFPGGKVLFGAPEKNKKLTALHDACDSGAPQPYPWTPHATLLLDAPEKVCAAVPVLVRSFSPLSATITRLHLCAFWPTREIASLPLNDRK